LLPAWSLRRRQADNYPVWSRSFPSCNWVRSNPDQHFKYYQVFDEQSLPRPNAACRPSYALALRVALLSKASCLHRLATVRSCKYSEQFARIELGALAVLTEFLLQTSTCTSLTKPTTMPGAITNHLPVYAAVPAPVGVLRRNRLTATCPGRSSPHRTSTLSN
jgi:hypothetical protein